MTPAELQSKLKTHTPRLLSCEEAGMSGGPWKANLREPGAGGPEWSWSAFITNDKVYIADELWLDANARFIAATNGKLPWAEMLWKIYCGYGINAQEYQIALDLLTMLDDAGRLGWRER